MPSFLSRNRPHIFSNHLEISGLRVADFGPDSTHVAGVAEREIRLVLEADNEVQCPVHDVVGDEIHHLAMNLRIPFAKLAVTLLYVPVDFPAFLGADRDYRRIPDPNDS